MSPEEIKDRMPALRPDLLNFAHSRVPPHLAEELVQETFLKLLDKDIRVEPEGLKRYAVTVVRNLARAHYRRAHVRREAAALESPETGEPIAVPVEASQERVSEASRTIGIINSLAEPYRSVALDVLVEGRSQEEAAERAGIPVGSVKSKVTRLREQLQHTLTTGRPLPPRWRRDQCGPRDDMDEGPEPGPAMR